MGFVNLLVFVGLSSFGALVFLFCWRLYASRNLSKEKLYRGIVEAAPFFADFKIWLEEPILDRIKTVFLRFYPPCGVVMHKIRCRARLVSNRLNGKKDINSNGCSGYWKELNGTKDDEMPR